MDSASQCTSAPAANEHTSLKKHQGGPSVYPANSNRAKKQKGGRKRRNRRQSFALPHDNKASNSSLPNRPELLDAPGQAEHRSSLYRLDNRSNTSVDSDVLLDHR